MANALTPIARPQGLAAQVHATLRQHLREGRLRPGDRLTEVDLATRLEVSRTPVREALARLASEGLVDTEGRGYTVPVFGENDVDDIYEVRMLLEPEAIRQVAGRGRSSMPPVERAVDDAEHAHADGQVEAFVDANVRFRDAWIALVRNARLVRAIVQYDAHVRYLRATTLEDPGTRAVVLAGMKRVRDALVAADGDAAARAMLDHLSEARRAFGEVARQGAPELFGANGTQPAEPR